MWGPDQDRVKQYEQILQKHSRTYNTDKQYNSATTKFTDDKIERLKEHYRNTV